MSIGKSMVPKTIYATNILWVNLSITVSLSVYSRTAAECHTGVDKGIWYQIQRNVSVYRLYKCSHVAGCRHDTKAGSFAKESFRNTDLIPGRRRKSLPQEQLLKVTVIFHQGMLHINCNNKCCRLSLDEMLRSLAKCYWFSEVNSICYSYCNYEWQNCPL